MPCNTPSQTTAEDNQGNTDDMQVVDAVTVMLTVICLKLKGTLGLRPLVAKPQAESVVLRFPAWRQRSPSSHEITAFGEALKLDQCYHFGGSNSTHVHASGVVSKCLMETSKIFHIVEFQYLAVPYRSTGCLVPHFEGANCL